MRADRGAVLRRPLPTLLLYGLGLLLLAGLVASGYKMTPSAKAAGGNDFDNMRAVCTQRASQSTAFILANDLEKGRTSTVRENSRRCFGTDAPSASQRKQLQSALERVREHFTDCGSNSQYVQWRVANARDKVARGGGADARRELANWEKRC